MLRHMDLYYDCKTQNAYRLHKVATLSRISPHLKLKTLTTHILERTFPIEPEPRFQIIPTVIIVPQELVIRACTEEALRVIIGTCPDLIDNILCERMFK